MKYSIHYLTLARQDLLHLVDYLIQEYGADESAVNLLAEIDKRIAHLADFPYSHPLYQSSMRLPVEMRYLPVKNHVIFYTVLEPDHVVEIRRVLHMRQSLINQKE